MIQNPNPVSTSTFSGMWITNLSVILPTADKAGLLTVNFQPYDGSHLLATGGKRFAIMDIAKKSEEDATFKTMIDTLIAECKRQANKDGDIKFINVMAQDTARPVVAQIVFDDKIPYTIKDCFALAGSDTAFAGVFQGTMNEVAKLAGLSVE